MGVRKTNVLNISRIFLLMSTIVIFIFPLHDNMSANGANTNVTNSNGSNLSLADTKYDIIVTGDWYCNEETQRTINNVMNVNPDLIITTGDHVKEVESADCWIEMSAQIKDKMKIAIGNHDVEFEKIYKQIVDYHQLDNPYYSHVFQNIHFVSLSTEHPFEVGSKQYEFIQNDLEKASKNPAIDWIIVHQHKALYSTNQDKKEANDLRDIYQPLFQKYDVDIVLSSHNQYYERTFPILYNVDEELTNDKSDTPKPIVTVKHEHEYPPNDGIVFLSIGTAGDELDPVSETHNYHVIQKSNYGFLNLELSDQGKTLTGEFHTNDGQVLDHFVIYEH
jgi:3',5'-cyclic AMP phosphodiesterase CpdA